MQFAFDIKGMENGVADALSRLYIIIFSIPDISSQDMEKHEEVDMEQESGEMNL